MKSHKSIACIDFVNVNVALNSHAYKKNLSSILWFVEKYICFVALLNPLNQATYDHIMIILAF